MLINKNTKMILKTIKDVRSKSGSKREDPLLIKELQNLYNKKTSTPGMEVYLEIVPGQSYGPRLEKLYIKKHGYKKVKAGIDQGDFKTAAGKHAEYKFTYSPRHKKGKYNFVQIRPWQNIVGYVFEAYCDVKGFITFHISKSKMKRLLKDYGQLAHGTKKTNKNSKKLYSLRGHIGDELWKKMLEYDDPKLLS